MKDTILGFAARLAPIDLLQQVRFELKLRAKAHLSTMRGRARRVLDDVHRDGAVPVNLGCGPLPTPGWLNIDGLSNEADLLQVFGEPLALPDACASMAFSEHVLEHIDFPGPARVFLEEVHRILVDGAYFRVIVPDAGRAMMFYANGETDKLREMTAHGDLPIEMVNRIFRENGFHRWAWDYALLERELLRAGFSSVRRASYRDSAVSELNIDFDEPERIVQSLYVEARK